MSTDPGTLATQHAYRTCFGEASTREAVVDDLVALSNAQNDPLVRAGVVLAVHRIYAQLREGRAVPRVRETRKGV